MADHAAAVVLGDERKRQGAGGAQRAHDRALGLVAVRVAGEGTREQRVDRVDIGTRLGAQAPAAGEAGGAATLHPQVP